MFSEKRRFIEIKENGNRNKKRFIDQQKRIALKKDEIKEKSIKGEKMNLYFFFQSIIILDGLTRTPSAQDLGESLKVLYDYKVQWLQQSENSEQLKRDFQLEGRFPSKGKEEAFHPRSLTEKQITRAEALNAFDKAHQYLTSSEAVLAPAIQLINPFFTNTQRQLENYTSSSSSQRDKAHETLPETSQSIQEVEELQKGISIKTELNSSSPVHTTKEIPIERKSTKQDILPEPTTTLTAREIAKSLLSSKRETGKYSIPDSIKSKIEAQQGLELNFRKEIIREIRVLDPTIKYLEEETIGRHLSKYRDTREFSQIKNETDNLLTNNDTSQLTAREIAQSLLDSKRETGKYSIPDSIKSKIEAQQGLKLNFRKKVIREMEVLDPKIGYLEEETIRKHLSRYKDASEIN